MISSIGKLLPVDGGYQRTFLHEFAQVSRAVATATIVSALAQGVLGGIGYYFAGLSWIWLLILATMFASLIPFVGAALVWIPCSIYLFYTKNVASAVFLGIYGIAVVSMVDNLVKPMILQGRTSCTHYWRYLAYSVAFRHLDQSGFSSDPWRLSFFRQHL